jgi:hypothetical protein
MSKGPLRYRLSIHRHFGRSKLALLCRLVIIIALVGLVLAIFQGSYFSSVSRLRPVADSFSGTIFHNVSLRGGYSEGRSWFATSFAHEIPIARWFTGSFRHWLFDIKQWLLLLVVVIFAHATRPILPSGQVARITRLTFALLLGLAAMSASTIAWSSGPTLTRYLDPEGVQSSLPAVTAFRGGVQLFSLYLTAALILLYLPLIRPRAPHDCESCRYNLQGLPPVTDTATLLCPECGTQQPDSALVQVHTPRATARARRRSLQLILISALFILTGLPLFISILTRHADPVFSRIMHARVGSPNTAQVMVRLGEPLRIHTHQGTIELNFEAPNPQDNPTDPWRNPTPVFITWTHQGQPSRIDSTTMPMDRFGRSLLESPLTGRAGATILDLQPVIPGQLFITRPNLMITPKGPYVMLAIHALRPFKVDEY